MGCARTGAMGRHRTEVTEGLGFCGQTFFGGRGGFGARTGAMGRVSHKSGSLLATISQLKGVVFLEKSAKKAKLS